MSQQVSASRTSSTWLRALIVLAFMVVLTFVTLVLVPNTLLGYLTTRVVPTWRDLIVVTWWVLAFIGCTVVFVRLQRRRNA